MEIINLILSIFTSPWMLAFSPVFFFLGYTWTTKTDNVDDVMAAHINNLQTEKMDRDGNIPWTGISQWDKGADVASASTLTLGSDGNYFDITGTTGITGINMNDIGGDAVQAGTVVKLHFDGALTITHNATSLVLPGGANITTAAGDELEFTCFDAANDYWRCTNYSPIGTLGVVRGGTGLGTYVIGDILYASSTSALSRLADVATGSFFVSGGVGVAPAWTVTPKLGGSSMMTESSAYEGYLNYATDAGRTGTDGRAFEIIVKSPNDANYYREILSNRQDCMKSISIITY